MSPAVLSAGEAALPGGRQVKLEDLLLSYLVGREVKPTLLRLLSLLMKLALLLASTCELE